MVHCTAKKLLTMSIFSIKFASSLPCIIDITKGMAIACTVFIFIGYFFIFTEFWLYFEITRVGFLCKTDYFFFFGSFLWFCYFSRMYHINTNFLFIKQYLFSKYLLPYGIMRSVVQIWWFKEALSYGGRYIFKVEINITFPGEQSRWSKKCTS